MTVYTPPAVQTIPKLYQSKPELGHPKYHGDSWKNLYGHDHNQDVLRKRHTLNALAVVYKLAGTIVIKHDLTVAEIRKVWSRIVRKLSKYGVVAWWIREIARRSGRIHYHLITTSDHTGDELKTLIRDSNPALKFRLQFDPIANSKHWGNYCCKSTTFKSKASFHAKKVVLFAKNVILDKHNEIGDFWQSTSKPVKLTPREKQANRDNDHKFREALSDNYVQDAATYLADATGLDHNHIGRHYARELAADPSLYQLYADDAYAYRIAEGDISPRAKIPSVGTFNFSTTPTPRKPPVRKKPKPPTAPIPFDPAKCYH
jgi:hypothetical protein